MWDQGVYIDRALSFGLREHQVHYLDDFLFLEPPSNHGAASVIEVALNALDYLSFLG